MDVVYFSLSVSLTAIKTDAEMSSLKWLLFIQRQTTGNFDFAQDADLLLHCYACPRGFQALT